MNLDFSFVARRHKGRYVLVAKKYGVVVRADELLKATRELQERVEAVAWELHEAGVSPPVEEDSFAFDGSAIGPLRRDNMRERGIALEYSFFFSKLVVVLVVVAIIVLVEAALLSEFLGPRSLIGTLLRHPVQFLVQMGDRAEAMPPTEVDQLRLAIRKIAAKAVPLIEETKAPPAVGSPSALPNAPSTK